MNVIKTWNNLILMLIMVYSTLYIKITRTDKWYYRDHDKVHIKLMNLLKIGGIKNVN